MSLWPLALGMGSAALAASTLMVPAARRLSFGSVAFDWLGQELELDRIDPDGMTVRTKAGTLMRAYRIGGMAYDTKPEGEQFALHQGRTDFIHACASRGVVMRNFAVKRRKETLLGTTWPSPALQEIGDAEAERYRNSWALRRYMTLQAPDMTKLEEADEKVAALMAKYQPERLERPLDPLGDCPLTGFLNFLVCGDLRDDLRAVSSNISANLQASSPLFDKASGQFTIHLPHPWLHRIMAVHEWPDLMSGHLLHELMAIAGEIEVSQVCVPLNRDTEVMLLKRAANNPLASAMAKAEALACIEILQQGKTSRLNTQAAITMRARTAEEIETLTATIARILGNRRVTYSVQTREAAVMWFNRMPERERLVRPLKLMGENVAAIWPFESAPVGLAESPFGPAPVRSFTTGGGQDYAFQFHCKNEEKALANFLVVAPAGVGKTSLIMHLLGGLAKFDRVRSFVLDSKEGARFTVEAMGGQYQPFDKLALNPLDIEDTGLNRQRLALQVRSMLGDAGQDDGIEDILSHVVETAFTLPIEARTFDKIFPLTFPAQSNARKVFARWVTDQRERTGLYANTFNAPRDSLASVLSQSFMTGINMNEALEDPTLGPPVVAHIASAIERLARSGRTRGFAIFIDEAAKLLLNPAFCALAAEMYREYRKFGGAVGMAFQDPGALHKSGIADAVIENTASFFFFPNPQGNRKAYAAFNLNDEQEAFIFGASEGRKVLLVKRDAATGFEESVILDVNLAPLGKPLRFYRSGPDAVRDLLRIQEQWGDQWPANI
ncbi:putative Type IV secretion system protein VirB4/ [Magnetospirillum gryphiswaldense MSR-1 v2]|uniref:Type IV secretion system protein VirB4 n=1 Tax=Magnetospirillum gryphiswaldense (strain DSM 6361 / JCM 21280 / NBRC 15271 / MSR-1) TaxID=431944 RepID=V6F3W3_MAGGM|nr:VirB4 family type IV secretion system protein [Magnetospirillum gryphiswaldense]CDK99168.1 putative Type IV secretion system protein VirB4/ [Magnetospirillum gryphiswaldense MSR-1 v2]